MGDRNWALSLGLDEVEQPKESLIGVCDQFQGGIEIPPLQHQAWRQLMDEA